MVQDKINHTKKWKAAVIGAGSEALHAMHTAKKLGVCLVAYDGNPEAMGLKAARKSCVIDISKEETVVSALKTERPDFILSVPIGRYLTTIGAVNDALSLRGVSKQAAALSTDKYAFHELMSNTGYRSCACVLLQAGMTKEEAYKKQVPYPAILKPRYGSGSRGISYLQNEAAYQAVVDKLSFHEDYVLEEAAAGEEYGVDGAVNGEAFHLVLLRRKILTPLPERQAVGYLSVVPSEEPALISKVNSAMEQAARLIGLQDCLMHADILYREGKLFVIELSARPSGHNLHNLFTPLATGVDAAKEYCRLQMGEAACFVPAETKKMLIHYFDFENQTIRVVPDLKMLPLPAGVKLVCEVCNIKPGEFMGRVPDGHSLMGRGYFILEGETDEQIKEAAEEILRRFL